MLSARDNQIIRLSVRSQYQWISGCELVQKSEHDKNKNNNEDDDNDKTKSYTEQPFSFFGNDQITIPGPSYFDQFLKTTASTSEVDEGDSDENSTEVKSEVELLNSNSHLGSLNETVIFNATNITPFKHDVVYENKLENSSSYKNDVEELFVTVPTDTSEIIKRLEPTKARVRRYEKQPAPTFPKRTNKDKLIVRCHKRGKFLSSRQRWWYIAMANCGSEKGLDITYRFKMTNGPPGSFFYEHFSADEMCKLSTHKIMK